MAVDTRHRDKGGEISQKHGSTFRIDFFEERARQCRAQAKRANNKADRESWLEMARRWEGMLRPHHDRGEGIWRDRLGRMRFRQGRFRELSQKRRHSAIT
jgi:hypothetical protein